MSAKRRRNIRFPSGFGVNVGIKTVWWVWLHTSMNDCDLRRKWGLSPVWLSPNLANGPVHCFRRWSGRKCQICRKCHIFDRNQIYFNRHRVNPKQRLEPVSCQPPTTHHIRELPSKHNNERMSQLTNQPISPPTNQSTGRQTVNQSWGWVGLEN